MAATKRPRARGAQMGIGDFEQAQFENRTEAKPRGSKPKKPKKRAAPASRGGVKAGTRGDTSPGGTNSRSGAAARTGGARPKAKQKATTAKRGGKPASRIDKANGKRR